MLNCVVLKMCQGDSTQLVSDDFWRVGDNVDWVKGTGAEIFRPDIYQVIEAKIQELDKDLRQLSLDIHGELLTMFQNYLSTKA